jgi:hypothetical protein
LSQSLLGTSAALAFDTSKLGQLGSLPLDDLAPLIAKSGPLQQSYGASSLILPYFATPSGETALGELNLS